MWVRKRVPAATTRRERVEGEGVDVGEGRRRDMSSSKQPQLGLVDRLDADGNSASDLHHSSSSAIGANFSIHGPIVCRCCPPNLLRLLRSTFESVVYSASYSILSSGDSVKGTVGPELAYFYRYNDGYDRQDVGKIGQVWRIHRGR